jgi:hypothetical protein
VATGPARAATLCTRVTDVTGATQPAQTPFNALGYLCDRQMAGTRY